MLPQLSPVEAYALRRLFARLPPIEGLPIQPMLRLLMENATTPELLLALQTLLGSTNITYIFHFDPLAAPPLEHATEEEGVYVPELLPLAHLSDAALKAEEAVGPWLDDFITWATARSPMTPRLFLESGGLWILGLMMAGRATLRLSFAEIHPHLYILWIALTSHFKKTTGLNAITDFVQAVAPHLLLASQNTPELLAFKLSGQKATNYDALSLYEQKLEVDGLRFAAQRGIIADEASKLFLSKKYLEGLTELFLQLYDAPRKVVHELRSEGKLIINQPALSIIGATTPIKITHNMSEDAWDDGTMARFVLLTPQEKQIPRLPSSQNTAGYLPPPTLIQRVRQLYNLLPAPPEAALFGSDESPHLDQHSVGIDAAAFQAFEAYAEAMHEMTAPKVALDNRLRGNYARFPIQALKVAMQLAAIDWADQAGQPPLKISLGHWARAQQIVESWRASAHRVLADINQSEDLLTQDKIIAYLKRQVTKNPTRRDIQKGASIKHTKACETALNVLLASGLVLEVQRGQYDGKPVLGYALRSEIL